MSTGAIVVISTIVVLLVWAVAIYNQLVALKNRFKIASPRSRCSSNAVTI